MYSSTTSTCIACSTITVGLLSRILGRGELSGHRGRNEVRRITDYSGSRENFGCMRQWY